MVHLEIAAPSPAEAREERGVESFSSGLDHNFGTKNIGFLAGCALLVNNITGPGVPQLPNMFVEAGWLIPTLCIVVIWLMTTVSASMYCEAMRKIDGNDHFRDRVEYTTIVKHYFGQGWYKASQIGLNGALQSLNIVSVIQSAQVMDNAMSAIFGRSCALNLTPFQNIWTNSTGSDVQVPGSTNFFSCVDTNDLTSGNPWGCHVVLTLGYVVTMAMAIPCGRWNLDDNMVIQAVAFALTACCWLIWIAVSVSSLPSDAFGERNVPAINVDSRTGSQAAVVGTVLFNFGFVTTVPSWVNEKRPEVSVNRSLWLATLLCIAVFFAVGLLGGAAFASVLEGQVTETCSRQVEDPSFECAASLLQVFTSDDMLPAAWRSSSLATFVLRSSVYLFPIVAVVSSIPVFSIVIKYNMLENGFSKRLSFLWGVVFPWVVAAPLLYMPNVLGQVINLTSLIFVSFTDFIVPLLIFVKLQRHDEARLLQPTNGGALDGCPEDHAFPPRWDCSRRAKTRCAGAIALILSGMAIVATVFTALEGNYAMNHQICALVGS